jgi:hypothetical protein
MFGTLVISLPSAHTGGDVVVKHRHEKKTLRSSEVELGFMCWYSDVQHEVLPVTSGYRWVLTYNLAIDPSEERPSAGLLQDEISHLRRVIRRWLSAAAGSQQPQHRVYALDHHYAEASLSLQALKGRDRVLVQALRDISSALLMDVFLGILEKTDRGSCNDGAYGILRRVGDDNEDDEDWHSLDEIYETRLDIKKLVDLDGVHLAGNTALDAKSILQPDCFEDADGEEISYDEGYAGNEVSHARKTLAAAN